MEIIRSRNYLAAIGGSVNGTTLGLIEPAQARIQLDEIIKTATGNLSAAELSGTVINNFGQTDDCALTLPAAAEGLHFTVSLGTTVAKYYRFIPATGATIALDGSSTGANKYVQIASAAKYATIQFFTIQTGASTWEWQAVSSIGSWVQEA